MIASHNDRASASNSTISRDFQYFWTKRTEIVNQQKSLSTHIFGPRRIYSNTG